MRERLLRKGQADQNVRKRTGSLGSTVRVPRRLAPTVEVPQEADAAVLWTWMGRARPLATLPSCVPAPHLAHGLRARAHWQGWRIPQSEGHSGRTGVTKGCVSKWLDKWEAQGIIARSRDGRCNVIDLSQACVSFRRFTVSDPGAGFPASGVFLCNASVDTLRVMHHVTA